MEGIKMATLDKTSKKYEISNKTRKFIKFICKRKARRKFKQNLYANPKKMLSCGMHIFDKYW